MSADAPRPPARSALVTGGAGFIGSHLVGRLLGAGWDVTAVDNFDPFYGRGVKEANVAGYRSHDRFRLAEVDVVDLGRLVEAVGGRTYDAVVHLAARAGVRPSIADPAGYLMVNAVGAQSVLELARTLAVPQVLLASSSSVYGVSPDVPWREGGAALQPISPYAASKVAMEAMGRVYAHLHGVRVVCLRFFTVYGPRQRPDLAVHAFARRMLAREPIVLFGDGSTRRDYTYVDDVVDGIVRALAYDATPYEVINLGNSETVRLADLVAGLERALGVEAVIERLPEQSGDVPQTWADIGKAQRLLGYDPQTSIDEGLAHFAAWLREQRGSAGGVGRDSAG